MKKKKQTRAKNERPVWRAPTRPKPKTIVLDDLFDGTSFKVMYQRINAAVDKYGIDNLILYESWHGDPMVKAIIPDDPAIYEQKVAAARAKYEERCAAWDKENAAREIALAKEIAERHGLTLS